MNGWRRWNGDQALNKMLNCCEDAIKDTIQEIGNKTDAIIPLDEGPLMNSRYEDIKKTGQTIVGILSYGGGSGTGKPKLPYAIRWHENNANFQHGRQMNYLRGPFQRIAKVKLRDNLKSKINSSF